MGTEVWDSGRGPLLPAQHHLPASCSLLPAQALCARGLAFTHNLLSPSCYAAACTPAGQAVLPTLLSTSLVCWFHVATATDGPHSSLTLPELSAVLAALAARLLHWAQGSGALGLAGARPQGPGAGQAAGVVEGSAPEDTSVEGAWWQALEATFNIALHFGVRPRVTWVQGVGGVGEVRGAQGVGVCRQQSFITRRPSPPTATDL